MVHYLVFAPCTSGAKSNAQSNEDLAPVKRPLFRVSLRNFFAKSRTARSIAGKFHQQQMGDIELSWKSLGSSPRYFVIGHMNPSSSLSSSVFAHPNIKSQENMPKSVPGTYRFVWTQWLPAHILTKGVAMNC